MAKRAKGKAFDVTPAQMTPSKNGKPKPLTANVLVEIGVLKDDTVYIPEYVYQMRINRAQGRALKCLHLALDENGARLADGARVRTDVVSDAVRWLLDQLVVAMEEE